MVNTHKIDPQELSLESIRSIINERRKLALSQEAEQGVLKCRNYLDEVLKREGDPIYGVNTGFGALCDIRISNNQIEELQYNLVRSHACGVGPEVPAPIVRLMLFLKIRSLCYGYSGVSIETVNRLIDFYNHDILPVIYQKGSLGASGDLCPLAHLSLPLIAEGDVYHRGVKRHASSVHQEMGWEPVALKAKGGLSLLNGTQFMSAYGLAALLKAMDLVKLANFTSAISLDVRMSRKEPFSKLIHQIRPHPGQIRTAAYILTVLEDSEIGSQHKGQVQDPYSFRCIPQVHGASLDAIEYCKGVLLCEINSVTDNPSVFVDEDLILSGGNFHGQPLALACDFMAIAMAELGSISERRTYRLLSGERGLPSFLNRNSGLHSGLMIPQYTAASLVSQSKQLCTPSSVDSIPSCNEQEDHVSMGANGAVKAFQVAENTEYVLAIEFMTAMQALDFRRPLKSSPLIEETHKKYREIVPFIEKDKRLFEDIESTVSFIRELAQSL